MIQLLKKAVAAAKRYSEKNKIKSIVEQHIPAEYQPEAMARLMKKLDAPKEEKIRITQEVFDDIQKRINSDMSSRMETAKRREEFEKVTDLAGRLPEEFRQGVIADLAGIIELPRPQRRDRIAEIFWGIQAAVEGRFEGEIASLKAHYADLKRRMQERVLTPESPRVVIAIDYEQLAEKTKATFALAQLEQDYAGLLRPNNILYVTAGLGILFSLGGTFFTINSHLGDWIGGNESVSTATNAFLTIAANLLEATSLFMLLWFLPERITHGLARLLGIAGAILLVISVILLILMRTDIGPAVLQSAAGSAGRYQ